MMNRKKVAVIMFSLVSFLQVHAQMPSGIAANQTKTGHITRLKAGAKRYAKRFRGMSRARRVAMVAVAVGAMTALGVGGKMAYDRRRQGKKTEPQRRFSQDPQVREYLNILLEDAENEQLHADLEAARVAQSEKRRRAQEEYERKTAEYYQEKMAQEDLRAREQEELRLMGAEDIKVEKVTAPTGNGGPHGPELEEQSPAAATSRWGKFKAGAKERWSRFRRR